MVASPALSHPGGVARFCRQLVGVLRGSGHAVIYVDPQHLVDRLPQRGRRYWGGLAELAAARLRMASESDATVAITNGPVGWGIRRQRSFHIYHGTYAGQAEAIRPHISTRGYHKLRWLDAMTYERLAGRGKVCLSNSPQTAREVRRYFGWSSEVIWCPVDTARFTAEGPRASLDVPTPTGLFVGAGRPTKGPEAAFAVIRGLPDTGWIVVGQKTPPPDLVDRVVALERIPPGEMPAVLRSVDLLLAPSLYESLGLTVLEAVACGTPALLTTTTGAAGIVQEGGLGHWVVEPGDVAAALSSARAILADPQGAAESAASLRPLIEERMGPGTWDRNLLRVLSLP